MTAKLFIQSFVKFFAGVVIVELLVFLPAGTFEFFGGWLFMALLFVPMFIAVRLINEEKFLEKELDGYKEYKEKVKYRLILLYGKKGGVKKRKFFTPPF